MTDTENMTVPNTTESIVEDAERSLAAIDERIEYMSRQRTLCNETIARLRADRKPLARIVSAAKGRKSHSNGDTE